MALALPAWSAPEHTARWRGNELPKTMSYFINAGGVRTHYSQSGSGQRVLVALHGGGIGSSGLAGMGNLMNLLAAKYRVIAVDAPGGYGMTDPLAPAPYGILSRVHHLERFLETLCIDRCTLMGNSQGAWVAAKYALRHPDSVERLILIGSGSIARALGIDFETTPGMRLLQSYDGTPEGMERLMKGLVADPNAATPELIQMRHTAASRAHAREAFKRFQDGTRRLQNEPLLRLEFDMATSLPILTQHLATDILWGEEDRFAPPAVGRAVEEALPHAMFHWIPGAGHQVQTDAPEAVADLILR